jgi:hypothetical protein
LGYCRAERLAPYLLARHDPVILLLLRFEVADVILLQVDAHPVDSALELVLLAFRIVIGDRQSQVAADVQGLVSGSYRRKSVFQLHAVYVTLTTSFTFQLLS